jgi:hypothetical protein
MIKNEYHRRDVIIMEETSYDQILLYLSTHKKKKINKILELHIYTQKEQK